MSYILDLELNKIRYALLDIIDRIKNIQTDKNNLENEKFSVTFKGLRLYKNEIYKKEYPIIVREFFKTNLIQPERLFIVDLNFEKPEIFPLFSYLYDEIEKRVIFVREYLSTRNGNWYSKFVFVKEFGECSNVVFVKVDLTNSDVLSEIPLLYKIDETNKSAQTMIISKQESEWYNFMTTNNNKF